MDPLQDPSEPRRPRYSDIERSTSLSRQAVSPSSSIASLPYRTGRANASISTLFASTSSLPGSGRSSGSSTPTALVGSVFSPGGQNGIPPSIVGSHGQPDEPRNLILRAFVPHVGVLASSDTEEILQQRGIPGGFSQLIRPFGERIQGKVTIRNSVGASTTWDDFGIRFTGVKDALGLSQSGRRSQESRPGLTARLSGSTLRSNVPTRVGGDVPQIEEIVDRHLMHAEWVGPVGEEMNYLNRKEKDGDETPRPVPNPASPFYTLYFRRLLSALPLSPHETFSHPVACIIVISSRNPTPIEELRRLYTSTNTGDDRLPQWVNNEYLRYYVLVHDEDHDDIGKSTVLYEQMKRNFGLHCHLLRLRSAQCVPSDDDCVRLPVSEWLSAAEELAEVQRRELVEDDEDPTPCLFESDVTAVRTFVRELVAQSVVPSMERNTAQWNEQVAARRRGLGGRLVSLTKRWAPFGSSSSSRNSSSPTPSSNSNYDSLQGFYRPDAPEAIMRKLADYAFMLRDFKLAQSTYDLLRSDFDNDKAWKHYAGVNEMAAISTLLSAQGLTSKARAETIDRQLEAATHSYIHRSMTPYYALRGLAMGMELLKLRGSSATDDAARWGSKIVEAGLVGKVGNALFTERIGTCYSSRQGIGSMAWGSRRRKGALWAVLAADLFLKLDKTIQAEACLDEARRLYGMDDESMVGKLAFDGMSIFLNELKESIVSARLLARGYDEEEDLLADEEQDEPVMEEISESLDVRPHRHSLIGMPSGLDPLGALTDPLSPVKVKGENPLDGFQ